MSNILTNNINPRSGNLITIGGTNDKVSIAGTLTYEDVSNIDSVGIITARDGLDTPTNLVLRTGGTEQARIDSSGRLGIGTASPSTFLHVRGSNTNGKGQFIIQSASAGQEARMTFIDGSDDIAEISTDGNNLYFYNETATGAFQWYTNGSERMRIDSSGRLLVGTSSSSQEAKLTVQGNASDSNEAFFDLNRGTDPANNQNLAVIRFTQVGSREGARISALRDGGVWGASSNPARLVFSTTADGASSPTERMRITSAGSIEIDSFNNVSAGYSLRTGYLPNAFGGSGIMATDHSGSSRDGCAVYGHDGISFYTNGPSERVRITMSTDGQLLIGTTNAAVNSGPGVKLNGGGGATVNVVTNAATNININHVYNINATRNGYRYYLGIDGGIRNFSGSNVNLSDEREKKNIVDMNSTWSELKQWTLRQFHFNEQDNSEDKCYGVIAQQIETVSPQVLSTFETNPTTIRKGVKEQKMMWMAVKALQEAQTRIEILEQRLTDGGL